MVMVRVFLEGDVSDRINMIGASLSAFTLAASITSSRREDIRGVAVHLYSGEP